MNPRIALAPVAVLVVAMGCSGTPGTPGESPEPPSVAEAGPAGDGIYASDQADRGYRIFRERCSECHYASEMHGSQFQFAWERRTVGDLLEHISETMPEDDPGSLNGQEYIDVVTYILRLNGFPAGPDELRPDGAGLATSLHVPSGSDE